MIVINNIEYDANKNAISFHGNDENYVLAFIEFNKQHDEYDIRSIGKRCFELNEDDYDDLKTVIEIIDRKMHKNNIH